jgi:molybdopterin-guanine dinucleotide biosynthesis protein A
LHSGLCHSETESNLVLSCDIPLISSDVLEKLIKNSDDNFDVVQIQSQNKTMPLIALYKKQCMHLCLELLQQGEKRLRTAVQQFKTKTIHLESEFDQDVNNINTTQQLNALKHESEH